MKLYMAHVGFYDSEIGMYELHSNIFVVAEDVFQAKQKIKENEQFIKKKMHIDGLKEINNIDGYEIQLKPISSDIENKTLDYGQVKNMG